jgi:DNA-binding transcriptional ArsR family regulator
MVNYKPSRLDLTFGAMAHPIRRGILARLAKGEASVAELAAPHGVSAPAISKHLHILEGAGLMQRHKIGREHRCRLAVDRMKEAEGWIEHYRRFWEQSFDRLDIYLQELQKKGKKHDRKK